MIGDSNMEVTASRELRRAIEIREATSADAARLRAHYASLIGAAPWFPLPTSIEKLDVWLRFSGLLDFERNLQWIAVDGQHVAGHLVFKRGDIPSIGLEGIVTPFLSVAEAYRDKGIGGALMDLCQPVATPRLRKSGVRRIVAHIFPENGPSRKLAARVGLEFEGILRQHMKGADGRYHDMIVVGQLLDNHRCDECPRRIDELGYQTKEDTQTC